MKFLDDENASCMRADSLIPSSTNLIYDFGRRDPIKECLTKSLSTIDLSCEEILLALKFLRLYWILK